MRTTNDNIDIRALPLPKDWFISEEDEKKTLSYKGWIYRKVKKDCSSELPSLIFPI